MNLNILKNDIKKNKITHYYDINKLKNINNEIDEILNTCNINNLQLNLNKLNYVLLKLILTVNDNISKKEHFLDELLQDVNDVYGSNLSNEKLYNLLKTLLKKKK